MIWVQAVFVLCVAALAGYAYAQFRWRSRLAKLFQYLADVESTGRFVDADDWIRGWLKHVDPNADALRGLLLRSDSSGNTKGPEA